MKGLHRLDLNLLRRINREWSHPKLDRVMLLLTALGNLGMVWLFLMVPLLARQTAYDRLTVYLALAAMAITVFSIEGVVKPLVRKPRPFVVDDQTRLVGPDPGSSSFPSGHAASSIAAAIIFFQRGAFGPWDAALFLLALSIAYSRIYLGVHTPIDVAAGIVFGIFWAWVFLSSAEAVSGWLAPLEALLSQGPRAAAGLFLPLLKHPFLVYYECIS